jgi:hypothetical protein
MTKAKKEEIEQPCPCGWSAYIGEGQDEGYCFNEKCGLIVRRITNAAQGMIVLKSFDGAPRP